MKLHTANTRNTREIIPPLRTASPISIFPVNDAYRNKPTSGIGTGHASSDDYMKATNEAIRRVDPDIMILQAAGISTGEDVYRSIRNGSDASGGTSGILNAPDRRGKIVEMIEAMLRVVGRDF